MTILFFRVNFSVHSALQPYGKTNSSALLHHYPLTIHTVRKSQVMDGNAAVLQYFQIISRLADSNNIRHPSDLQLLHQIGCTARYSWMVSGDGQSMMRKRRWPMATGENMRASTGLRLSLSAIVGRQGVNSGECHCVRNALFFHVCVSPR